MLPLSAIIKIFIGGLLVGLLRKWLAKLAPYYEEGSALRKRTLEVNLLNLFLVSSRFNCCYPIYVLT